MKIKHRTSEINTELDYYIAEKYKTTIGVIDSIPLNIVEDLREYFYRRDYSKWLEWHD
jgi:hypothetical protein|tara:strand:- start:429 stop:602 length:174 start_codon:yes stop_codon:yes gene_type:complete